MSDTINLSTDFTRLTLINFKFYSTDHGGNVYYQNYGSAVQCNKLYGHITNKDSYNGNGLHIDETGKNLPENSKNFSNIGSIVKVKKHYGNVTFDSDVNVVPH